MADFYALTEREEKLRQEMVANKYGAYKGTLSV